MLLKHDLFVIFGFMEPTKTYPNLTNEKIYSLNEVDQSLTYSYANYLNWLFDERVELIKGKIFKTFESINNS